MEHAATNRVGADPAPPVHGGVPGSDGQRRKHHTTKDAYNEEEV